MGETNVSKMHYGWVMFLAMMVIMLLAGTYNTSALFWAPAAADLGVDASSFGFPATLCTITMAVMIPVVTGLYNRLNMKVFMSGVMVVLGAGYFLSSLATSMIMFYVTNILFGTVIGFLFMIIVPIVINSWFEKKASTLIGICSSAVACGGALWSIVGGFLIENFGWRYCYRVWAVIVIAVGVPVSLLLLRKSPQEMGLQPYGHEEHAEKTDTAQTVSIPGIPFAKVKTLSAFYLLAAMVLLISGCNTFYSFLSPYLQSGMSATAVGTANSVLMIGGVIGYIVIGIVCDKSLPLGAILCIGASVAAYPLLAAASGNLAIVMVSMFLIGLTYQPTCGVLAPAITQTVFGGKDFASIWGIMGTVISIGGAAASSAWAVVIKTTGYGMALYMPAVLYAVSLVIGLALLGMSKKLKIEFEA